MTAATNRTLAATLIATVAGTGAWLFGLGNEVWPAHPQIAVLLLTVATGIVVERVWPHVDGSQKKSD